MPVKPLKEFLDKQHVRYTSILHSPAFTAQEIAASAHISGKKLAKIVVVKMGNKLALVVLPAHDHINFSALKEATGSKNIDLASESDFKGKFPECEVGAMPPFGDLYGMDVYMSNRLTKLDEIVFNAGLHSELMQMSMRDFSTLAHPKIIATERV